MRGEQLRWAPNPHSPGRECPDGCGKNGPAPPSGELPGEDPAPCPRLAAAARLVVHLDGEEQRNGRPGGENHEAALHEVHCSILPEPRRRTGQKCVKFTWR